MEVFMDNILGYVLLVIFYIFAIGIPVAFIVLLIMTLAQIPKVKRKERKPTKLIVYGILSSVFLFETVIEILLIIGLAQGIAHM
jgi:1,4-dihydroxy-2-naphthoate octaprenyltransferase